MKTLLLTLVLAFTYTLSAQSLQIVTSKSQTKVTGNAYTTNDLKADAVVKNISPVPVTILVKRIDRNYTNLTDSNAICWGLCFTPDISVSPVAFARTLQPDEESELGDFSAHVYPDLDGQYATGDITYVFFDMEDPQDSVAFTISYEVTPDFSVAELEEPLELSVYPNPASTSFTINYDLGNNNSANFELVNVVGKTVYSTQLDRLASKKEVNVSQFTPGVYFYRLKNQGETLLTRKVIIK